MGNENGHSYGQDPTKHARLIQSEPGMQIYQDAQGQQFQKYVVVYDGSSSFDSTYYFRATNHHQYLVDVIFAAPPQTLINCAEPAAYHIVTERIPYRLTHLPPQTSENAFTILESSLRGFKDLFRVHGVMSVKDTMIGVTPKNRVKVWLNPNFALNKPEPKPLSLQNLDPLCHQRQMVHNIFDLISSKAQSTSVWKDLTKAREIRGIKTFQEAQILVEELIRQKRLKVNGELRNPFNKCQYGKKSQVYTLNSEIDKLQDIKLLQPLPINKVEETTTNQPHPPVPTLDFSSLKNRAINNNLKSVQTQKNQVNFSSRMPHNEVSFKPALRNPFQQIQRMMSPTPQPPHNFSRNQSVSVDRIITPIQPYQNRLIHFNQATNNNSKQKNLTNHSYSQPKNVQIRFNYQKQPSVALTNSINLIVPHPYIKPAQTIAPFQQVVRPQQTSITFKQQTLQTYKTPISFQNQSQIQTDIRNKNHQNISFNNIPVATVLRNDIINNVASQPTKPENLNIIQIKNEQCSKQIKKIQELKLVNQKVPEVKQKQEIIVQKKGNIPSKQSNYKNMFDELYDAQSTESLHIYKQQIQSIASQQKMADNFDSDEQPSVHRNFTKNKEKEKEDTKKYVQIHQNTNYQIKINKVASESSLENDNKSNTNEKLENSQRIIQKKSGELSHTNANNLISKQISQSKPMSQAISIESIIIKKTQPIDISKLPKQQDILSSKIEKQQDHLRKTNEQNVISTTQKEKGKLTGSGSLREKLSTISYKQMRKMLQQSLQGN